ncbi:hypothetical protein T265_00718 [Opisthorchis viverrini]|uniref:Uncharacterized protein n=1 Tax=Opisthorchis viverrini TaxID=6198 RepID=A0A075A532_OPIVI|nr:hypothetical protein T265_00718 [Opisthorchis viverrini]KER33407.1 hypothetical protein T265_00718 [Opisthorchis viverrini]
MYLSKPSGQDGMNFEERSDGVAQFPGKFMSVRGSNPTSATRLPLSRLGQPGSIPALVLPSGDMAARHRKGATAERFYLYEIKAAGILTLSNSPDTSFPYSFRYLPGQYDFTPRPPRTTITRSAGPRCSPLAFLAWLDLVERSSSQCSPRDDCSTQTRTPRQGGSFRSSSESIGVL